MRFSVVAEALLVGTCCAVPLAGGGPERLLQSAADGPRPLQGHRGWRVVVDEHRGEFRRLYKTTWRNTQEVITLNCSADTGVVEVLSVRENAYTLMEWAYPSITLSRLLRQTLVQTCFELNQLRAVSFHESLVARDPALGTSVDRVFRWMRETGLDFASGTAQGPTHDLELGLGENAASATNIEKVTVIDPHVIIQYGPGPPGLSTLRFAWIALTLGVTPYDVVHRLAGMAMNGDVVWAADLIRTQASPADQGRIKVTYYINTHGEIREQIVRAAAPGNHQETPYDPHADPIPAFRAGYVGLGLVRLFRWLATGVTTGH